MGSNEKKRRQVLLRLPVELVELLKEKAKEQNMVLTQFCKNYLKLIQFYELYQNTGHIVAQQTRRRLLMVPAVHYDQIYGANATYREGRRFGLDWAPMLGNFSVEETLALFSIYGWGNFEFQPEIERILHFNPPISSSEFIRGLIEGLTGLTLQTITADRDVFIYKIML